MPNIYRKAYYKIKAELYEAVEANDVSQINELLLRGLDVDVRDHENRTSLHLAAIKNKADSHFDTIEALLKNKASVNARDVYGKTVLCYAVSNSDPRTVKLFLDHKAKIGVCDEKSKPLNYIERESPLFEAIRSNNSEVVRLLVERGSNVNHVAEYGETPLHRACTTPKVNFDIVELLLSKGAKVNAVQGYRDRPTDATPLHCLSGHGDIETVRLLLEYKADVRFAGKEEGETPLFKAIRGGNTEVVELLVEHGSDVNHQANYGVSPLHLACCNDACGNPAIVEVLLRRGANVNARDWCSRTPLHFAVGQRKIETVRLLLEHHADVKILNNSRYLYQCALFEIAFFADAEIVQLLLDLGLDPNEHFDDGSRLLHEACRRSRNFEVVEVLLKKGARLDARNNRGKTPLYYSTCRGEVRTFQLLLDSGASIDDEEELLLNAVSGGNVEMARMLLEKPGLDKKSKSIALGSACSVNMSLTCRMIDLLLKNGAEVNVKTGAVRRAFHLLIEYGDVKGVKLFLDHDSGVDCINEFGGSALCIAARTNNVEIVKLLLDYGSNVNCKECPLHRAANRSSKDSHFEVIRLMLERKADINARDEYKKTPLDYLFRGTNVRTTELALKLGARSEQTSECILFDVLQHRFFENAQVLVDHGYDLDNVKLLKVIGPPPKISRKHLELNKFYFKNGHLDEKWMISAFLNENGESSVLMKFWLKYIDVNDIKDDENDNILKIKPVWYSNLTERPPNIWKMILKHIAKLQALEIHLHPSLINTITENDDYNDYFKLCENELTVAKNRRIDNSWISFLDLLVGSKRKLKNYAGNTDLINAFEKSDYETVFPSYKNQMRDSVKKGVRRRKLYDEASILLSELLPTLNPTHLIVRDTLDCISTKDLSKLCES